MKKLDFYFDFISPFAYFSWLKILAFCEKHGLELELKPIVFGKLLDHWGQLGPAEISPKREWLTRYCLFYADTNNIEFSFPKHHPFNPLGALRLSLMDVSKQQQLEIVRCLFEAGWAKGEDLADVNVVLNAGERAGLHRQLAQEFLESDAPRELLKNNTAEAISKGVFGVPTMAFDGELYWGNDQFEYLEQLATKAYTNDPRRLAEILSKSRGIDRKSK